jgi:hypothetical protein
MGKITKINIGFLAFVFLWQALRVNILNGVDGAGRLIVFISFIILCFNLNTKKEFRKIFSSNLSIKIWFIWFIYAVVNTIFLFDESHTGITTGVFILNKLFVPFCIISIVSSFNDKEFPRLLKWMEILLFVVTIIFILGSDFSGGTFSNELLNINELVLITISLVTTILLKNLKEDQSIFFLIVKLTIPTYFIVLSGSRMGFVAYIVLVLGYFFCKRNKGGVLFVFQICILGLLSYFAFQFVSENTVLGERLSMTAGQGDTLTENSAEGTIFEYFGDRGGFYINGWDLFIRNMPFGIGLLNYNKTNTFVLHVEFMIHLAELGIFGILLYLSFLSSLWFKLKEKMKSTIQPKTIKFGFVIVGAITVCATVLFLYNSYAVAYMFGLIIVLSKNNN